MRRRGFALAAALAAAACGGAPAELRLPEGTPVVLISIDTLRSDHLPAYGYEGVETPAIDELRREGVLFRHAYTPTPLTLPAHSSLLTGVLPEVHGVRDNVGYSLDPERRRSGAVPLLAPLLRARGYATGAAVSAYVLQKRGGLDEGFDLYEDGIEFQTGRGLGGLQRPGGETLGHLLPWLRDAGERPFLLFLHLYEPHTPYRPPEPYASRARSAYDGEIAAADAVVGELFAELRRLDRWDETLVVLLSDHGEGLGEHGEDEHGVLLYREAIQVPLLVKLPGGRLAGATAEAPVSLVDVAPTIADMLGIARPAAWSRPPLLAALEPGPDWPAAYAETFYGRLHFGWSDLAAVVDERFHLVAGPRAELYDHRADPGERVDLLARERRAYAELRRVLDAHDRTLTPPAAVDEESRQAMAALGYVGTPADREGALPDPRQHLGELRDLKAGTAHLAAKRPAEAVEAFRRVVAANPGMVDAWESLGHALQRLDRPEEALDAYQEALARSGGSPHIAVAAASLLLEMGRLDSAAQHARLASAAHPAFAHGVLAQVALAREQLDEAEREARLATQGEGDRVGPALTLGQVLLEQGRYEEALQSVDAALAAWNSRQAKDPELLRGAFVLRGRVLADLGRAAEAEAALRREIELFPESPDGYCHLALLLALTGRGAEVGPLLRTVVERHPSPRAYREVARTLDVLGLPERGRELLAQGRRRYPGNPLLSG